jgi:hypothetical protein
MKDHICETDCFVFVIYCSFFQFIVGDVVFLLIQLFCFVGMNMYPAFLW